MDILFLLIPFSAVLVLLILAVFGWAVHRGQFEDLDREGTRILEADRAAIDEDQADFERRPKESRQSVSEV
jgi:cbb3-type cytochrome oxidase maturation protein